MSDDPKPSEGYLAVNVELNWSERILLPVDKALLLLDILHESHLLDTVSGGESIRPYDKEHNAVFLSPFKVADIRMDSVLKTENNKE